MGQDVKEKEMKVVDGVDYLRGIKDEDSVLLNPANLPYPNTGGSYIAGNMSYGKWYRIAVGGVGSFPSTGIFNIANNYSNEAAKGILFYAFAEGFANGSTISKIASSATSPISKARVVFAQSTSLMSFLDILVRLGGTNTLCISASSLIGFKLQIPEEVSASIPEGYSVKELAF